MFLEDVEVLKKQKLFENGVTRSESLARTDTNLGVVFAKMRCSDFSPFKPFAISEIMRLWRAAPACPLHVAIGPASIRKWLHSVAASIVLT